MGDHWVKRDFQVWPQGSQINFASISAWLPCAVYGVGCLAFLALWGRKNSAGLLEPYRTSVPHQRSRFHLLGQLDSQGVGCLQGYRLGKDAKRTFSSPLSNRFGRWVWGVHPMDSRTSNKQYGSEHTLISPPASLNGVSVAAG